MLPLGDSVSLCPSVPLLPVSAAIALALVHVQTLSSLLRHLKHLGMLPTHMAARSWAQLSRLLSTAVSDQSSLGNFIPAFVCADCVCHARESSDGFTCQVQQENILSFLDQVAQRLRWSICFCGLLASPCKSCDSGVLVFENRA